MGTITVRLTDNALAILRRKIPGRRGIGPFLSTLVTADEAREEMRQALAPKPVKPVSTKESWSQTGCNVD